MHLGLVMAIFCRLKGCVEAIFFRGARKEDADEVMLFSQHMRGCMGGLMLTV